MAWLTVRVGERWHIWSTVGAEIGLATTLTPTEQASLRRLRLWLYEKIIERKPHARFHPR